MNRSSYVRRHHAWPVQSSAGFPVYLIRDSDHVPNIEMMMERHRLIRLDDRITCVEHITVQRAGERFLLYVKLSDSSQMSHHPEYSAWLRQALPLDEALGAGWRRSSETEAREMLGDSAT